MQYVSEKDIVEYLEQRKYKPGELNNYDLMRMVNWFAQGAVTTISNHIMEQFEEGDGPCNLRYQLAEGCLCGSCYEWAIVDEDTNKVVDSTELLEDWVKEKGNED